MAVKLALEATVITMLFIFGLLYLISLIKQKNICPICGEPCHGKFCCEAHELLHYSEEEFSREEWLDVEEDEALAEQEELEREERKMKSGLFETDELKEWQRGGLAHPHEFIRKEEK